MNKKTTNFNEWKQTVKVLSSLQRRVCQKSSLVLAFGGRRNISRRINITRLKRAGLLEKFPHKFPRWRVISRKIFTPVTFVVRSLIINYQEKKQKVILCCTQISLSRKKTFPEIDSANILCVHKKLEIQLPELIRIVGAP